MNKDYLDLIAKTNEHTKICDDLNAKLEEEKKCNLLLLEKEKHIRVSNWHRVVSGDITNATFDKIIKNDTFEEKVSYEKAKTERKIVENKKDAIREILYTIKKQIY